MHLERWWRLSPMYIVIRCAKSLSPSYLLHFLKSEIGKQSIAHRSVSGVRPMLRFPDLCEIAIPLPPREEQERVVTLFSEVQAAQSLRDEADER